MNVRHPLSKVYFMKKWTKGFFVFMWRYINTVHIMFSEVLLKTWFRFSNLTFVAILYHGDIFAFAFTYLSGTIEIYIKQGLILTIIVWTPLFKGGKVNFNYLPRRGGGNLKNQKRGLALFLFHFFVVYHFYI